MGKFFRRGARRSVAQFVALALVAGGAFAALSAPTVGAVVIPLCNLEVGAQSSGVQICKTGPETAVAGTEITYTLDIDAWGSTNKNFQVDDTVPDGTSLVSVTPSDSVWDCSESADPNVVCKALDTNPSEVDGTSISVVVKIDSGFTDEGIENCATVSRTYVVTDSVDGSGISGDESCWETEITREWEVSILKTGPASLVVPNNITYTVAVSNAGPSDSDPVSFTDPIPEGTTLVNVDASDAWDCTTSDDAVDCETLDGVPAGETLSVAITLAVPIGQAGTALTNCASLVNDEEPIEAAAAGESCVTIAGENVTVKAEAVTGVAPRFTG